MSGETGSMASSAPGFALRPGISFCRVAGRTMFLDLPADRYFCLSPAGDRAFTALVNGEPLDAADRAVLDAMAIAGPVMHSDVSGSIAPCPAIDLPSASLLDTAPRDPRLVDMAMAGASLVLSPIRLRVRGLSSVIGGLERRKARKGQPLDPKALAVIAASFAKLRYIATEHDNCLTRSIAVAARLIGAGGQPVLIIAVKLQPFAAHAWVQSDGWLVNDRHEIVRDFTPILIV